MRNSRHAGKALVKLCMHCLVYLRTSAHLSYAEPFLHDPAAGSGLRDSVSAMHVNMNKL